MKPKLRQARITAIWGMFVFAVSFCLPTPAAARVEPANGFGLFMSAAWVAVNSGFGLLAIWRIHSWEDVAILLAGLSVLGNIPTIALGIHALIQDSGRITGMTRWQLFSAAYATVIGFLPPYNPLRLGAPYGAWVVSMWLVTYYAVSYERIRRRALAHGFCNSCGYNLTGNLSGICPECGKPVPPTIPDSSKT